MMASATGLLYGFVCHTRLASVVSGVSRVRVSLSTVSPGCATLTVPPQGALRRLTNTGRGAHREM